MPNDKKVVLEDVKVIFRNFTGRETEFNRAGDRNFCVLLEESVAQAMQADGWNVKRTKERDEEGIGNEPYLKVAVNLKGARPPKVVMITTRGRSFLTEETVETLDWVDILNTDLILNPYEWVVNGKTGVKAYLDSIYMTIQEDPLEMKYGDLPQDSSDRIVFSEPEEN